MVQQYKNEARFKIMNPKEHLYSSMIITASKLLKFNNMATEIYLTIGLHECKLCNRDESRIWHAAESAVNCTQRSENQQVNNLKSRALAACKRGNHYLWDRHRSADANLANNNRVIAAERFHGLNSCWNYKERKRDTHTPPCGNNMIFNCDCCFDADAMPTNSISRCTQAAKTK